MRVKNLLFALLLALSMGLVVAGIVVAQQPTPSDDQVNAIAKQLYCPVCENIPLDVCPTTACARWRELIRQKLAEGKTEQEIKDYFVQQYGDRVLGTPPVKGINWLAYIIPPVAILAGAYVVYRAFRAWKRPITQESLLPPILGPSDGKDKDQDNYMQKLEDEVRKR